MSESPYRVDTTSRLARWRIENLEPFSSMESHPFKIGKWNWYLSVQRDGYLCIKLFPEISNFTREIPPIASFKIRVISSVGDLKCLVHPDVLDKMWKSNEDFSWMVDIPCTGKFIIDVEFLDLKLASSSKGTSIWNETFVKKPQKTVLASLGRMLSESMHTDITIHASDGKTIEAHRAVLASRSPVFRSMFSHDLREKQLSSVNICDMSIEACQAFLNYIYGNIKNEEFLQHRQALLQAADKYDVSDLKEACHDSLVEDIDSKNVLLRLQNAALYQLPKLKNGCMLYLVKFGKIIDIGDELNAFVQCADRELIGELFAQVLAAWKGF
ncbi:BTB/POZ domain-containing protein [Dorcoceras hygrometricum]|uniref:BTB/POZ domain-containing protein n=1 Tax=Dorcoceras hygrometricum TaxID=472368 RepID=A0A2Z7A3W5_9LAMI|nr:BTB/POZ domain-containing protein [Dorcoceras hygrometricum]